MSLHAVSKDLFSQTINDEIGRYASQKVEKQSGMKINGMEFHIRK
jgi:hypothetical protein